MLSSFDLKCSLTQAYLHQKISCFVKERTRLMRLNYDYHEVIRQVI